MWSFKLTVLVSLGALWRLINWDLPPHFHSAAITYFVHHFINLINPKIVWCYQNLLQFCLFLPVFILTSADLISDVFMQCRILPCYHGRDLQFHFCTISSIMSVPFRFYTSFQIACFSVLFIFLCIIVTSVCFFYFLSHLFTCTYF